LSNSQETKVSEVKSSKWSWFSWTIGKGWKGHFFLQNHESVVSRNSGELTRPIPLKATSFDVDERRGSILVPNYITVQGSKAIWNTDEGTNKKNSKDGRKNPKMAVL
jgi:hypothetical protein